MKPKQQKIFFVSKRILLTVLFIFSTCINLVHAQTSGYITGSIRDANGGAIHNAKIIITNVDSGVTRTTNSDIAGKYNFPALPPGIYSLRAESAGFSPTELKGIIVYIESELNYDLILEIRPTNEEVIISAKTPLIDTTGSEAGGVISQQQISNLPINSRQYLTLALLLPGTSLDSTRSFFPTVNVGGSLTFNSTANIVDGANNNWIEDGEPRQNFPVDAVQEFKVSNAQFKAEFGFSTGGIVQVVTKSGTNEFHGNGFIYFRDKELNARGVFETQKPDFRRSQFGGSLGGPFIKNKMHFFLAVESTQQKDYYTVRTGSPQFYSSVEGTYEKPSSRNIYLARIDWQPSNFHNLFARYAQEDEHSECSGCGGTIASTGGFDQDTPRRSIVIGDNWVVSPKRLNEFRFQYARGGYYISPNGAGVWKDLGNFSSERSARLRRTYIFPSLTYGSSQEDLGPESRWQFINTHSIFLRNHSLKFGGDYNILPYTQERTGNILGTYIFSRDQYFNPNDPASIANLTGAISFAATIPPIQTKKTTHYFAGFIQDDWKINPNLTLNLGLRYERFYGSSNEDLNTDIFPINIPFIDTSKRGNNLNFGPRIGIAWSPLNNNKMVLRSGYGVYYGHVRIGVNLGEYRNYQQFSINISNPAYPDLYQGRDPYQFISSAPANINILANNFHQPYSHIYSAGVSFELPKQMAIHIDGTYNRTLGDRKIIDINPRSSTGVRPMSQFARVDQSESSAELKYRALYVKLEKRYSENTQFLVSYTYTKSDDNNPLARYIDPFDKTFDSGPSNGERRHSLIASGSITLPLNINLSGIWTVRSQLPWTPIAGRDLNLDGFNTDLVPGTTRNSGGRNLNLNAVNAWRQLNNLTPINESQIESSKINILDALINKEFVLKKSLKLMIIGQAFNLFNRKNLQSQYGGGRVNNSLSSSFGRILTARPNRQFELALRVNW